MAIYREETFGPVAPVISYEDPEQVVQLANDTNYGLAAYVYTRDISEAMRAFEGLRIGIIGINDCLLYTSPSPRDSWASRMQSSA